MSDGADKLKVDPKPIFFAPIGTSTVRYALYAKANGRTPEAQLAADKVKYPGGCMTGFILWISARQRDYTTRLIEEAFSTREARDHDFEKWLITWVKDQLTPST